MIVQIVVCVFFLYVDSFCLDRSGICLGERAAAFPARPQFIPTPPPPLGSNLGKIQPEVIISSGDKKQTDGCAFKMGSLKMGYCYVFQRWLVSSSLSHPTIPADSLTETCRVLVCLQLAFNSAQICF